MKNIILTYLALFLAFSLSGQKYVQEFTKTDGTSIAISLSDLAFGIPSGTANGSVLVLSPSAKTIYVTDSLHGIFDSSSAMLVLLEESYKLNGKDAVRDVAISKQQVKEVIPSGASQTFLKLASPQKTILINDDYATVAAALSAASSSGGGGGGNGIYGGSGSITDTTFVNVQGDSILLLGDFTEAGNLNVVPFFQSYSSLPNLPITNKNGIIINDSYTTPYFYTAPSDSNLLGKYTYMFTGIKSKLSEFHIARDTFIDYSTSTGDTVLTGINSSQFARLTSISDHTSARIPRYISNTTFTSTSFNHTISDSLTVAQRVNYSAGQRYYFPSQLIVSSSGFNYSGITSLSTSVSGYARRRTNITTSNIGLTLSAQQDTIISGSSNNSIGTTVRIKPPGQSLTGTPTPQGAFAVLYSGTSSPVFTVYGDANMNGIVCYSKYNLPNQQPSVASGARSFVTWTGTGAATTSAMTRTNWNVTTAVTDGSGDITITHLLPDATFAVNVTIEGTTARLLTVHTKDATTFKVRALDTSGTPVTATSVDINWIANDN